MCVSVRPERGVMSSCNPGGGCIISKKNSEGAIVDFGVENIRGRAPVGALGIGYLGRMPCCHVGHDRVTRPNSESR
jgi:hypothetical protein